MSRKTIESLSDEILKTAGFVGRTLGAATLGAGLGATKGVSANESNPNASADEKASNILGGAAGGALIAGTVAGPGIYTGKKIGKKIINKATGLGSKAMNFFKHSEMEVPHDQMDKSNNDEENIKESPNETEKRRMLNTISDKDERMQHYKYEIEKEAFKKTQAFFKKAGYLKDIECEECGYSGPPEWSDGRCPNCSAMGGVKMKETDHSNTNDEPLNRELMEGAFQRAVEQDRRESISYY